jgi:carboxymethylenebutenolidase
MNTDNAHIVSIPHPEKHRESFGFCLGGSYALQLACLDGNVKAVSVVSGQNPSPRDALKRACPIVGSYVEGDFFARAGKELDRVLDDYNIRHEIKIYAGGIHSLFRESAKGYDPNIANDAWNRTLAFFEQHFQA